MGAGNRHQQRIGGSSEGLTERMGEREREGGWEGMENSMMGTLGSSVTWDVKSAAIWGKILSAIPG